MPLYEYRCEACGAVSEVLVRGNRPPTCEQCQSDRLKKLLSLPAAHTAGRRASNLPVCDAPPQGGCGMGGCGLPDCG